MAEAICFPVERLQCPSRLTQLAYVVKDLHRPLFARCCACQHSRRLRPMALAAKYGWNVTMREVARRLRWIACGSRECQMIDFDPKAPPLPQPSSVHCPSSSVDFRPRRRKWEVS